MSSVTLEKWKNQFDMTYEQEFKWKYTEWVYLIRAMEKELGKEKAHNIVRKARDKFHSNRISKLLSEREPFTNLDEYIEFSRKQRETPFSGKVRTLENLVESLDEYSYQVKECLWAKTFKDLDASDIGCLLCEGASEQVGFFSPNLRFERPHTLMAGDPYCDYKTTWQDDE
jgi:hypothetical protein